MKEKINVEIPLNLKVFFIFQYKSFSLVRLHFDLNNSNINDNFTTSLYIMFFMSSYFLLHHWKYILSMHTYFKSFILVFILAITRLNPSYDLPLPYIWPTILFNTQKLPWNKLSITIAVIVKVKSVLKQVTVQYFDQKLDKRSSIYVTFFKWIMLPWSLCLFVCLYLHFYDLLNKYMIQI